jgi:hypothetical protein
MAGEIITHPQQVSGLTPKAGLDKILNVPVSNRPMLRSGGSALDPVKSRRLTSFSPATKGEANC